MRHLIYVFVILISLTGCHKARNSANNAINKAGETVGKGASEFVNGVSQGIDETFQCKLTIAKSLVNKGLNHGKFKVSSSENSKDNVLTVYLIFDREFRETVSVKVYDSNGQEYGRSSLKIEGDKAEAKFFDFIFDKRTDIEKKSSFVME